MADKFIIHGAAFNGDGTSSVEATVDGGAGAWNNINIFHGTTPAFGTLAAGDRVFIRSKTSAGADLTVTLTASLNLGLAAATDALPVFWIIDNGAVWTGIDGVITYDAVETTFGCTLRAYNHLVCLTQNSVVFKWSGVVSNINLFVIMTGSSAENFCIDGTGATGYGRSLVANSSGSLASLPARAISPNFKVNRFYGSASGLISASDYTLFVVENPVIEINDLAAVPANPLFNTNSYNPQIHVNGGELKGSFVTTNFKLAHIGGGGTVILDCFAYPNTISPVLATSYTGSAAGGMFASFNADAQGGSELVVTAGEFSSRSDNNPPTLNAVKPDSVATPWSWRMYPLRASYARPLTLKLAKMFTGDAAAKMVTVEFLVPNTLSLDSQSAWATVIYIDDMTGKPKMVSSRTPLSGTPAALASSTATWSATTWGAISFTSGKKKIVLTTPTAIRKDTVVHIDFSVAKSAGSANDILFVCPDAQIS